jgi:NADPH:quinone reductase
MKAIGYRVAGSIDREDSFVDIELPRPKPAGRDILVEIKAVSVNPVDYKMRQGTAPLNDEWKVVGYDAAGIVTEVGPETQLFKPGDEVFYAGSIDRSGTNAQFHLVDERIVGSKPGTLGFAEAAALPLTAITAWEALFDRLDVGREVSGAARAIVIVGGAGGVGSIAVQLARRLTDLTVIATASRPETAAWVITAPSPSKYAKDCSGLQWKRRTPVVARSLIGSTAITSNRDGRSARPTLRSSYASSNSGEQHRNGTSTPSTTPVR